jgi:hypothetical protein
LVIVRLRRRGGAGRRRSFGWFAGFFGRTGNAGILVGPHRLVLTAAGNQEDQSRPASDLMFQFHMFVSLVGFYLSCHGWLFGRLISC